MLVAFAHVILRREAPKNLVIGRGIVFRERDSLRPAGAQNDRPSSYLPPFTRQGIMRKPILRRARSPLMPGADREVARKQQGVVSIMGMAPL